MLTLINYFKKYNLSKFRSSSCTFLFPEKIDRTRIVSILYCKPLDSSETVFMLDKVVPIRSEETEQNRAYLKKILQTLVILAKQGIPLVGSSLNRFNKGNFLEFLDSILEDNPEFKEKSFSCLGYTNPGILKELLIEIAEYIQIKILPKASDYFSSVSDEYCSSGEEYSSSWLDFSSEILIKREIKNINDIDYDLIIDKFASSSSERMKKLI